MEESLTSNRKKTEPAVAGSTKLASDDSFRSIILIESVTCIPVDDAKFVVPILGLKCCVRLLLPWNKLPTDGEPSICDPFQPLRLDSDLMMMSYQPQQQSQQQQSQQHQSQPQSQPQQSQQQQSQQQQSQPQSQTNDKST